MDWNYKATPLVKEREYMRERETLTWLVCRSTVDWVRDVGMRGWLG
jgi:hypothetical protein